MAQENDQDGPALPQRPPRPPRPPVPPWVPPADRETLLEVLDALRRL